jgi:hypothetical protein
MYIKMGNSTQEAMKVTGIIAVLVLVLEGMY